MTSQEQQSQYLLQVVESHRQRLPVSKKSIQNPKYGVLKSNSDSKLPNSNYSTTYEKLKKTVYSALKRKPKFQRIRFVFEKSDCFPAPLCMCNFLTTVQYTAGKN